MDAAVGDPGHVLVEATSSGCYAWFGAEARRVLAPSASHDRLDIRSFADRQVHRLLTRVLRDDLSTTTDLRFARHPATVGLRSAILCRVDGPDERTTAAHAEDALRSLETCELAAFAPLDRSGLLGWMYGLPDSPTWGWLVERRLVHAEPALPDTMCAFKSVSPTVDSWHRLLDALIGTPDPTVVSVRLTRTRPIASDWDEVEALATAFEDHGFDRYLDTGLGERNVRRIVGSPFAAAASAELRRMLERSTQSAMRYRFGITVVGMGRPADELVSPLEELVPTARSAPAFSQSALRVCDVRKEDLRVVDDRQRSLDLNDLHHPAHVRAPGAVARFVATVDEMEAMALLHVPRFGPPPTPGFSSGDTPAAGIPREPFVFVSYSRADEPLAGELVRVLHDWNMNVWWDRMLVAGSRWETQLEDALRDGQCRALVVVLTERAVLSEWVRNEIDQALQHRRPVLQVLLRPCPPIVNLQYVDLVHWRGSRSDDRLARLERDVRLVTR